MRIAYILASFPNTSEIFIINEIAEVLRQGADVKILSQFRPAAPCPHAALQRVVGKIAYPPPFEEVSLFRFLLLHIRLLLKYRLSYISAFLFAIKHPENAMLWTFKISALFIELIQNFKPDLIHTHFAYGSSRIAMMTSKIMGIPYTFTIHGWGDLYNTPPPDLDLIILNSKQTITVCDYNREYILKTYKVPQNKVIVVRCGISPFFFEPVDHSQREKALIFSVGRLHYHKAFHFLVEACGLLAERGCDFRLLIAGEGELRKELEAQIERLNLNDKVTLLGALSNEEIKEIMLKAEIFVMSSSVETVGLAAVEALACEVPVVATRVFGVPEMIIDGETGLLCEAGDPDCIANSIEKLLLNHNLRKEMGLKGRALALKEHHLPTQVSKLLKIWKS